MKISYCNNKYFLAIPMFVMLLGIFLIPQTAFFAYITEDKIINLSNLERKKIGVGELTMNKTLTSAAKRKGEAILKNQIFKHNFNNRKFSDWIKEENYEYAYVGENLAIDFATNTGVINAWLASPSHKKNLLNKNFTEIGVAIVEGKFKGEITTIVIQVFGTPLNSLTPKTTDNYSDNYKLSGEISTPKNETKELSAIYAEDENNLYTLLSDQKLIYKKFNPINDNNIKITFYVTCFYSIVLVIIFLIQKWQNKEILIKALNKKTT